MSDVTLILKQIDQGDPCATEKLLPLVYDELRKLAMQRMQHEQPGHMLQATALVHETYLRLVQGEEKEDWKSRAHFFGAAANAMRRILVEAARAKNAQKRGGEFNQVELPDLEGIDDIEARDRLLDLDEALSELQIEDSEAAELVKLRLFVGVSVEEAGKILGMSRSTAYENWDYVRSWFAIRLGNSKSE